MREAVKLLDEIMANNDCSPSGITYNPIIARYCKEGKLDMVLKYRHCPPNEWTYNAIAVLCGDGKVEEEAFSILQSLGDKQNFSMHAFSRIVISFLCRKGNTYAAFQLLIHAQIRL